MAPFIILIIIVGIILYAKYAPYLNVRFNKKKIMTGIVIIVLILLLISSIRIIPPGYVGVQILLGKVQSRLLSSGFHFVIPIVSIYKMSIRTQEYTMSIKSSEGIVKGDDAIEALTKDGLTIKLDLTVWFQLDDKKAGFVYETIGPNYVNKIVRPAIRTAIRDAVVNYNVTEIYSIKRKIVTDKITELLLLRLKDKGIILDNVLLRNVQLPPKVKNAISEKIAAEQEAQKMVYVLQKEEKEKERKLIEAQGIAQANKTIRESLSRQYLQWYYIQNLKEVLKSNGTRTVILPFDQKLTPLINLD